MNMELSLPKLAQRRQFPLSGPVVCIHSAATTYASFSLTLVQPKLPNLAPSERFLQYDISPSLSGIAARGHLQTAEYITTAQAELLGGYHRFAIRHDGTAGVSVTILPGKPSLYLLKGDFHFTSNPGIRS